MIPEFDGWPRLAEPIAVAAFEGWNDAGDAASNAVDHLREVWDATPVAEIDPDPYYDFQVNRPTVSRRRGRHAASGVADDAGCTSAVRPGPPATSC